MVTTTVRKGAGPAIEAREEFYAESLTGSFDRSGISLFGDGKLSSSLREQLSADRCAAFDAGSAVYVIRSYQTPIAWVTADGEVRIPADKYSVTTSKHQSIVRRALA